MPGGTAGALAISIITTFWALVASVALLWPGLLDAIIGGDADASLPEGFAGERAVYERTQFVPLVAMIALGLVFHAPGARTRRQQTTLPTTEQPVPAA